VVRWSGRPAVTKVCQGMIDPLAYARGYGFPPFRLYPWVETPCMAALRVSEEKQNPGAPKKA